MAFLTAGGSQIGSSNITDGAIVNADINAGAAIAQSKLAGITGASGQLMNMEIMTATPYSLTTFANEKILVFGTCKGGGLRTIDLKYNGVTKSSHTDQIGTDNCWFSFQYMETPGAGTQDLTLIPSGGVVTDIKLHIIRMKV